jgi:hypothetical protein
MWAHCLVPSCMLHACPNRHMNELYLDETSVWISWTLTDDVDHEWSKHDHPPPTAVWRRRLKTGVQFILVGGATGAPPRGRSMRHLTVHHKVANMWLTRTTNRSPRLPHCNWRQRWLALAIHISATACPHDTCFVPQASYSRGSQTFSLAYH